MTKRIKSLFYNLNIKTKIVLLLYSFIFLCLLLISFIVLIFANKNSRTESLVSISELVSYNNLVIEREQQYLLGIASYFAMSSEVQNIIHLSNEGMQTKTLSGELLSIIRSRHHILNLALYNQQGENIDYLSIDGSCGIINQDIHDYSRPISQLFSNHMQFIWEYIPENSQTFFMDDNSPKICLWYAVKDNATWTSIGAIAISLDIRKLFPDDSHLNIKTENLVIVDQPQKLFFGRGELISSISANDFKNLYSSVKSYNNYGSFVIKINGASYFAAYQKIPQTKFINFALSKDSRALKNMHAVIFTFVISIVLCLLLMLPVLILISNFLTRPLNRLMRSMESFRDGNRDVNIPFKYNDEIGHLGEIFNSMVAENNKLIEKTYLLTIRSQNAELAKLQAQINPHFIYNTLNELQWMAIDNNDIEVAEMANSIGQLFRISLNDGLDFILIKEEKELLLFYLSLQERRFPGRLSYDFSFDNDILSVKIPKLLIQPLVENASIHGTADANSHVHIDIKVYKKMSDRLHIIVSDDGVGIPPEKLKLLPDKLPDNSNKSGSHFALKNIAKRLKLYYNEDYSFCIQSEVGKGTEVTIDIPIEQHNAV